MSPLTNEAIARINAAMQDLTAGLQNMRVSFYTEDPAGDPALDQERIDKAKHDATVPAWAEDAWDQEPAPHDLSRGGDHT